MKKVLAIILALAMIFSFAACGQKEEAKPQPEAKEVLTMATEGTFPPYEFYDGDKLVGIDVEVGALIAEKLGMDFEATDIAFDSIIPGVQAGKYDMGMAGMTVYEERLKQVNFTTSYATGVQVVIVPEEASLVASLDDLANVTIGVQESTTGHIYCEDEFGAENVVAFSTGVLAVQALLNGDVDCVVIDNEPAKAFVAANEGLTILDTEYAVEEYAAAISKDNEALLAAFNEVLDAKIADGTVAAIVAKYINAE